MDAVEGGARKSPSSKGKSANTVIAVERIAVDVFFDYPKPDN